MVWYTQIVSPSERGKIAFYESAAAQAFLNNPNSEFLFVCGLKGVGKTLLLRNKSAALRNTSQGVRFIPENELAETIQTNLLSWDEKAVGRLSTWFSWQAIWRTVLAAIVCKVAGQQLPNQVAEIFPGLEKSTSASSHLAVLLAGDVNAFLDNRFPKVDPFLKEALDLVKSGVRVFLDEIDSLVTPHHGIRLMQHDRQRKRTLGHLSADVWTTAQIGFARAARDIGRNNSHIRIYGALRQEAFDSYVDPDRQNLRAHVIFVQYSQTDLYNLFLVKLQKLLELNPEVFRPAGGDIIERFFGFRSISHPTVKKRDRAPFTEDPIQYLIRHTRGRPRELVELGKGIQSIAAHDRNETLIRERVRLRSREFFTWAQTEAFPYWYPECDDVLRQMKSNWLSRDERELYRVENGPDPFEQLFLNGLAGCTVKTLGEDDLELRFHQCDPDAPVSIEEFRQADYYAIHPCVNLAKYFERDGYEPNPWNVSGHRQPFVRVTDSGHVHIGGGALGLGCVVPLLAAGPGVGICVVQRKGTSRWDALASSQKVNVNVKFQNNGGGNGLKAVSVPFTVIRRPEGAKEEERWVKEWSKGQRNIFVLFEDIEDDLIASLLGMAESISTAVKGRNLRELTGALGRNIGTGRTIYPFENDESAVRELRDALRPKGILVADVSVDRICLAPELSPDRGEITVRVEKNLRLYICGNTALSRQLFCPEGSPNSGSVQILDDQREFDFYRLRKLILVNGVHFIFALASRKLVYDINPEDTLTVKTIGGARVSPLFARTPEVLSAIERASDLFILQLLLHAERIKLIRTDDELRNLRVSLFEQQGNFLDRLQGFPDMIDRIFTPTAENFVQKGRAFLQAVRLLPEGVKRSPLLSGQYLGVEMDKLTRDVEEVTRLYLDAMLEAH